MISQNINLWARLRRWFTGEKQVRKYKAAQSSRLHKNWTTQPLSANYDIRQGLRPLRARSREECQNNPLFKKYLSLCRSNIVGSQGMQLQCRARTARGDKLQTKLNKQVENLWWEFCDKEMFSASGRLSFLGLQWLIATATPQDGELFIQLVNSKNKFGLSIKTYTADWLDETYNDTKDGNRIIMSVEVDNDNRPVAYWFTTPASEIMFAPRQERRRVRVPAEEVIHVGRAGSDESAIRYPPWFYATLLKAKYLNELQNTVLLNVQVAASTLGFIKKDMPDEAEVGYDGSDEIPSDKLQINYEPASFTELDAGMSVEKFDPGQPTDNHAEHVKIVQGEIATGNDVNYFELTGDLSEVNYSSARIGLNASRDVWRELQQWLGETVCTPIYHEFLRRAWMSGLLQLTPREFSELQRPMWRGRGWEYIEPMKDIQSDAIAIAVGLKSRTGVLADRGVDITDFLETVKSERKEIDDAEIEFSMTGKDSATPQAADPDDDEPDPKPSDKKKDKAAKV